VFAHDWQFATHRSSGQAWDLIAPIFATGATTRLVDAAFGLESMTSVRALRPL
jgi:hypothetical protein